MHTVANNQDHRGWPSSRGLLLLTTLLLPLLLLVPESNAQETAAIKDREVLLFNGELKLNMKNVPVLGRHEAPYVILQLFDYTSPACRGLHPQLKKVMQRYGRENITFIALPVPLNVACNPLVQNAHPRHRYACVYARYGMAMAAIAPDKFEQFHDWIMTGENPPLLSEVREHAYGLVDKAAFDTAVNSQRVDDWISDGVAVFKNFDGDAIPKLITPKHTANLNPVSLENLYIGMDRLTGLRPKY